MRNVTLDCPVCETTGRTVGDPAEDDHGHSGRWYCFACGAHGTYGVSFSIAGADSPPVAAPPQA